MNLRIIMTAAKWNFQLWDIMPKQVQDYRIAEASGKLPVKHVADADEVAEAYLFCMKCV